MTSHGIDRELLIELIAKQGYELDRGPDLRQWPADEQDLHREPEWPSFDARRRAVQRRRQEKLADAVLAALKGPDIYAVGGREINPRLDPISLVGTCATETDIRARLAELRTEPFGAGMHWRAYACFDIEAST